MRLFFSWALVSVLLGYGIVQTAITAAKLFQ
ncbi:MFS transporter small subunit [Actinoplanes missouriensis]